MGTQQTATVTRALTTDNRRQDILQGHHLTTTAFILLFATLLTATVMSDDSFDDIESQAIKASDDIYSLTGKPS